MFISWAFTGYTYSSKKNAVDTSLLNRFNNYLENNKTTNDTIIKLYRSGRLNVSSELLLSELTEFGKSLLEKKEYNKADSIFNFIITTTGTDNKSQLASAYFQKGMIAKKVENGQGVIENFHNAAYFYSLEDNQKGVVFSYLQIGIFFSKKRNYSLAEAELNKALVSAQKSNDIGLLNLCYLNYGHCYLDQYKYDQALSLYKKVAIDQKISNKSLSILYNNLSNIYRKKNNYQLAEYYLKSSIAIKERIRDFDGVYNSKVNLINVYLKMNRIGDALHVSDQIKEMDVDIDTEQRLDSLYTFAHLRLKLNAIVEGIDLLDKHNKLRDSLSNAAFSDKLIEMQKSFELKEKDQEIALLQKEDALNQARLKTKNILIAVTGSFLLILILVGYLINRQRKELAQSRRRLLRQKEDISGMNDQLRVSNLAKDRILSVIGHDLRGPVGGLKELIELYMELPEYEPNDIKNLLKTARESSTSTYHLLENLLSWANSQRGDIVFNPVATPLAPLIKQSVQLLDRSINVRNVRFEYDIPQALVIQVDMNMLRTIIRNLVSNALKYSPDNGLIKIMVQNEANQVKFCICDQGKGMTADETQNIFKKKETYFIGSELTAKGTGLGLILCKEFVERHGGSIWINSEEGVGTQVWFSILQKGVSTTKVNELQSSTAQ